MEDIEKINKEIENLQVEIKKLEDKKQQINEENNKFTNPYLKGECDEEEFIFKIEHADYSYDGKFKSLCGKYLKVNGAPWYSGYDVIPIKDFDKLKCKFISKEEFLKLAKIGLKNIEIDLML